MVRSFFLSLFLLSMIGASEVIVSVAPYKSIVQAIGGDDIHVMLFVPEGTSPHSFEPTPKEMVAAAKAQLWFTIGEHFEEKAFSALRESHPKLVKVDLRAQLPLIPTGEGGCHSCCAIHGFDLHIWLSPKLMEEQAKTIKKALAQAFPEKSDLFEKNLTLFLGELSKLQAEGATLFAPLKGKTLFAAHGAFAYLCRDFGLRPLTIEREGKEATPKALASIIQEVKRQKIKTLFSEVQYSQKPGEYLHNLLGIDVVILNPYAEAYLLNMHHLYQEISKGL